MAFHSTTDPSSGQNSHWYREENSQWPGQSFSLEVRKDGDTTLLFDKTSVIDFGTGPSPGQHIQVFDSKSWGRVLLLDGVIQLTERDECSYQEMLAHLPLFGFDRGLGDTASLSVESILSAGPKSVLIVGGGDGGILREVCKHRSVQKVVQCEIDGLVVGVAKKFFGGNMAVKYPRKKVVEGVVEVTGEGVIGGEKSDSKTTTDGESGTESACSLENGPECAAPALKKRRTGATDSKSPAEVSSPPSIYSPSSDPLFHRKGTREDPWQSSPAHPQDDPRVEIKIADAFNYIKSQCAAESFDVIIVDSSDPVGPAEKLFTLEFYQDCARVLTKGGVIATQGESIWLHQELMCGMMKEVNQVTAGDDSSKPLFAESRYASVQTPTYPCGQISLFVGRKWMDGERDEEDGLKLSSKTISKTSGIANPKPHRQPSPETLFGYYRGTSDGHESEEEDKHEILRYYSSGMHKAAFVLPRWAERRLAAAGKQGKKPMTVSEEKFKQGPEANTKDEK